ncbi:AAA family ATPase [Methylovirgula sp. 4M-Z18]|uniref:AAA family ATPase n=1 Tax=Methylovirgula sp. 4M-Z18 TaxID=2293567 RepID=UPI000E2FDDF9|nr:AAA family ATPase [Methylovirgula sp. 4M-Z18]RFB81104.1 protein tyrosine kinase [Methylovirgula sp. 4M-Z18]
MFKNDAQNLENLPESLSGFAGKMQAAGRSFSDLFNFARGVMRRRLGVILISFAMVMALCFAYLRIVPPTYTAQVQVLLANQRAEFVQQQSLIAEPALDLSQIETQLQIINSKALAATVIDQLKLASDPDLNGSGPSIASLWGQLRARIFSPSTKELSDAANQPPEDVVAAFQSRLTTKRLSFSNVIEISYSSSSPTRAADIANAIASAYMADQQDAKVQADRDAARWLQQRLWDLDDEALKAERAVTAFKYQNNIVSSSGTPMEEQQMTELNNRLVAARAQTADAAAKLDRYEAVLRANSGDSPSLNALDSINTDVLNSPIVTSLRQQYLELTRRESEWSTRLGPSHSAVIELETKIRSTRASIIDEVKRLAATSKNEFEAAKQKQQEIENQLTDAVSRSHTTDTAELTIHGLESRAKGLRTVYNTFLQRYMSSVQQESFPVSETRVISPASPPLSKSKPKTAIVAILGLVGGIGIGLGLALLRDLMDCVFRTPLQISAVLGTPCLSLVPALRKSKAEGEPDQVDGRIPQRTILRFPGRQRTVIAMPWSRFAEAIRAIKLSIDMRQTGTMCQVIGITSALPNEGKTTIAVSLAQLIGHGSGKRVVIVDCDMRNPSLSTGLVPNARQSIIDVVHDTRSVEEIIWHDPKTKLDFLPAAKGQLPYHTSEILSSDGMRKLFGRLRETYDYIIVDLPPLTPLVDVRAAASLIDSFILVVEWGSTRIDVVQYALHSAPNVHASLIGAVLNKTDIKAMARYDSYWGKYYSDRQFAHYGFSSAD